MKKELNVQSLIEASIAGGAHVICEDEAKSILGGYGVPVVHETRAPDPETAALQVIARGLNVRQTEALALQRRDAGGVQPDRGPRKDPDIAALERSLTARLGLRVTIAAQGKGGTLRIRYRSLDQLDGLLSLLARD